MGAHVEATVMPGHRVASGACNDPRFPQGTIAPQLPFLRAGVPDLDAWLGGDPFCGTLNLAVAGTVEVGQPEIRLPGIRWTDALPPETFFLSHAELDVAGTRHRMFLYIPDPATKPDHHQPRGIVELLGRRIEGVGYGARVTLFYREGAILIRSAG